MIQALISLCNKVNIIKPSFVEKLGFYIGKKKVVAQKTNEYKLEIFRIIIISVLMKDKSKRLWFLKEPFLLANININIALRMSFFILNNVKINFTYCELN